MAFLIFCQLDRGGNSVACQAERLAAPRCRSDHRTDLFGVLLREGIDNRTSKIDRSPVPSQRCKRSTACRHGGLIAGRLWWQPINRSRWGVASIRQPQPTAGMPRQSHRGCCRHTKVEYSLLHWLDSLDACDCREISDSASSIPAVSINVTDRPSISMLTVTASRVVPAMSATMATCLFSQTIDQTALARIRIASQGNHRPCRAATARLHRSPSFVQLDCDL